MQEKRRGNREGCIVSDGAELGRPPRELLALQWADIDWGSRAITIAKSLEQTAAGLRVKTTKNKKCRRFFLPQALSLPSGSNSISRLPTVA